MPCVHPPVFSKRVNESCSGIGAGQVDQSCAREFTESIGIGGVAMAEPAAADGMARNFATGKVRNTDGPDN